eukprot:SAG11_NODE_33838_length_275_cov_0.585227_1_plen_45_part_01
MGFSDESHVAQLEAQLQALRAPPPPLPPSTAPASPAVEAEAAPTP